MRETGRVKWYNDAKGLGYIGRMGGPDVFVHFSAIAMEGHKTLSENDAVEFDVVDGPRGPLAARVVVIERSGALPMCGEPAPARSQVTVTAVPAEDFDRVEKLLAEVLAIVSRLTGQLAKERAALVDALDPVTDERNTDWD